MVTNWPLTNTTVMNIRKALGIAQQLTNDVIVQSFCKQLLDEVQYEMTVIERGGVPKDKCAPS